MTSLSSSTLHVGMAASSLECWETAEERSDQERTAILEGGGRPGPFGGREVEGQWAARYQNKVGAGRS